MSLNVPLMSFYFADIQRKFACCFFMSCYCIYLQMPDYLAQWLAAEQGSDFPVKLLKGSAESKFLEFYISKLPKDQQPHMQQPGEIAIEIPYFRFKPPETYNHLSNRSKKALLKIITDRFDIELWKDIHQFGRLIKEPQDERLYAWMEVKGIECLPKNWDAIAKRYQRMRAVYLNRQRSKNFYKKNRKKIL